MSSRTQIPEDNTWLSRVEAMRIIRRQRQKDLQELQSWKYSCLEYLAGVTFKSEQVMYMAKQLAQEARQDMDLSKIQKVLRKAQELLTRCHDYTKKFDFSSDSGETHTIEIREGVDVPETGGENDEGTTTVTKLEFLEQQLAALKNELDYHKGHNGEHQQRNSHVGTSEDTAAVYDRSTESERASDVTPHSETQEQIVEEEPKEQRTQVGNSYGHRPDMTSLVQQAHQSVRLKNVKTRGKTYNTPRRSVGRNGTKQEDGSLEGILKRSLNKRFAPTRESMGSEMSPSSLSDSDSNMGSPSPRDEDNSRRLSGRKSFGNSRRRLSGVKSSCGAVVSLRPPTQQLQTVTENQSDHPGSGTVSTANPSVSVDQTTTPSGLPSEQETQPAVAAKKPIVLDSIKSFDKSRLKPRNKETESPEEEWPAPKSDLTSSITSFDKNKLKSASGGKSRKKQGSSDITSSITSFDRSNLKSPDTKRTKQPEEKQNSRKPFSPRGGGGSMLDQIKSVNLRSTSQKRANKENTAEEAN
eukprot:gb/GECG01011825.1/.p1 GENE.gb/GECG01011825.1/~~gb/GECG01011825.1/.p1  ORF type:complete len:525 (+),score=92.42 gb/GECG01011825.1/:1-1575(+)